MRIAAVLVLAIACSGPAATPEAPIANKGSATSETCCCKSGETTGKPTYAVGTCPAGACMPAAACENKRHRVMDEALAKYAQWTKDMCACPPGDMACAKRITDEQVKWGEEMAKSADREEKVEPGEAEEMAKRMQPIMEEYTKCAMAAMTPPTP